MSSKAYVGALQATKLYLGVTSVIRAYLGSTLVFGDAPVGSTLSIGAATAAEFATNPDVATLTVATAASKSTFVVKTVSQSGATPTVTDSKGNVYNTSFTVQSYTGPNYSQAVYTTYAICENAVGDPDLVVTVTMDTISHPHGFGTAYFTEIKDSATYPTLDTMSFVGDGATPFTESITTGSDNELVLAFIGCNQSGTETHAVASPFTIVSENTDGGAVYTGAVAWAPVASAGPIGCSWTTSITADCNILMLAFKSH